MDWTRSGSRAFGWCVTVLGAWLAAGLSPVESQGIADRVEVCAGCHGQDGKPIDPSIPVIWGQQLGYLYIQLRDFKRGDRKNEIMQPIAAGLEKQDMLDIAEYFSNRPWPDLGQPQSPKEVAERALRANRSVGCTGCHLDHFQGDGTVPRLAGMGRDYLTKTIGEFRSRTRGNNPGMSDLMMAASPDELAALAEYLAGL